MLKAVHFRGAGGGAEGEGTRFQSRLGREVFMLTCKARLDGRARRAHCCRANAPQKLFSDDARSRDHIAAGVFQSSLAGHHNGLGACERTCLLLNAILDHVSVIHTCLKQSVQTI